MDEQLTRRARMHAALGEPARLAIVDRLLPGDASPGELGAALGLPTNLLAHHLRVLGLAAVCVCLMVVSGGILQAWGHEHIPVVTLLTGGAVKIAVSYQLVSDPAWGIRGAAVGTLLCYALIAGMNLLAVGRTTGIVFRWGVPLRTLVAVGAMAVTASRTSSSLKPSGMFSPPLRRSISCGTALYSPSRLSTPMAASISSRSAASSVPGLNRIRSLMPTLPIS